MTKFIALVGLLVCAIAVVVAPQGASAYTTSTDVVFVHGYGSCQDAAVAGAGPLQTQYYFQRQAADKLHSVMYYGCDTRGESIIGAGPRNSEYFPSADNDYLDTDIRHISYELAWYLYDTFTARGLPVDLVGHSMGGIIAAYALQQVKARNPWFPPTLIVKTVVTFSSPFAGFAAGCPTSNQQCRELAPGSDFIRDVSAGGAAQMSGGTFWVIIGSTGCDVVTPATTLSLRGAAFVVNYSSPCYSHVGYLWDSSNGSDAVGTLNGKPFTGGAHALALMRWALL